MKGRLTLYRVAVVVALLAFGHGVWRALVVGDRSPGLFWQILFPLLVLRLALSLYQRSRPG